MSSDHEESALLGNIDEYEGDEDEIDEDALLGPEPSAPDLLAEAEISEPEPDPEGGGEAEVGGEAERAEEGSSYGYIDDNFVPDYTPSIDNDNDNNHNQPITEVEGAGSCGSDDDEEEKEERRRRDKFKSERAPQSVSNRLAAGSGKTIPQTLDEVDGQRRQVGERRGNWGRGRVGWMRGRGSGHGDRGRGGSFRGGRGRGTFNKPTGNTVLINPYYSGRVQADPNIRLRWESPNQDNAIIQIGIVKVKPPRPLIPPGGALINQRPGGFLLQPPGFPRSTVAFPAPLATGAPIVVMRGSGGPPPFQHPSGRPPFIFPYNPPQSSGGVNPPPMSSGNNPVPAHSSVHHYPTSVVPANVSTRPISSTSISQPGHPLQPSYRQPPAPGLGIAFPTAGPRAPNNNDDTWLRLTEDFLNNRKKHDIRRSRSSSPDSTNDSYHRYHRYPHRSSGSSSNYADRGSSYQDSRKDRDSPRHDSDRSRPSTTAAPLIARISGVGGARTLTKEERARKWEQRLGTSNSGGSSSSHRSGNADQKPSAKPSRHSTSPQTGGRAGPRRDHQQSSHQQQERTDSMEERRNKATSATNVQQSQAARPRIERGELPKPTSDRVVVPHGRQHKEPRTEDKPVTSTTNSGGKRNRPGDSTDRERDVVLTPKKRAIGRGESNGGGGRIGDVGVEKDYLRKLEEQRRLREEVLRKKEMRRMQRVIYTHMVAAGA